MGAGDEIMASGRARLLYARKPLPVRIVAPNGVARWHEVWEHNPHIAGPAYSGAVQKLTDCGNFRPYAAAKTGDRWTWNLAHRPAPGELYFAEAEREFADRVVRGRAPLLIVEPHLKPRASPNKQWGWVRWNKLAWLLQREGLRAVQLGRAGTATLEGVDLIETASFRLACAVLARVRAAVLPEGGLHHAAAALAVPAVVIFGGFIPVELTGYDGHRNLGVSGAAACGMRRPCAHCAAEMEKITPEQVAGHLMEIWHERDEAGRRSLAA